MTGGIIEEAPACGKFFPPGEWDEMERIHTRGTPAGGLGGGGVQLPPGLPME